MLFFTHVWYPANFSTDSASSWSSPKSFDINVLDYVIPSYSSSPFCCFLPYSPYQLYYGWQPLFWHIYSLIYIAILTFADLYSYLFYVGTFIVTLLILYYSPCLSILVCFHVVVLRVGDAWLVGVGKRAPHGFRCLWLVSPHGSLDRLKNFHALFACIEY